MTPAACAPVHADSGVNSGPNLHVTVQASAGRDGSDGSEAFHEAAAPSRLHQAKACAKLFLASDIKVGRSWLGGGWYASGWLVGILFAGHGSLAHSLTRSPTHIFTISPTQVIAVPAGFSMHTELAIFAAVALKHSASMRQVILAEGTQIVTL
jgi:mannose/fructose-specific phosphotransferase system component IIA